MGKKELGLALLLLVGAFLGWKALTGTADTAARAALRLEVGSEVPSIGLDRLGRIDTTSASPSRDVFKFGRDSRADLSPVPTPVHRPPPSSHAAADARRGADSHAVAGPECLAHRDRR